MPDCSTQHTSQFGVINRSRASIVAGWIQGICRVETIAHLPADYVRDTGVLMLPATDKPGESAMWDDLCRDKGIKIAVTDGTIAVKVRGTDGVEHDHRQALDPSPPGAFKPFFLFAIDDVRKLTADGDAFEGFTLNRIVDLPFV